MEPVSTLTAASIATLVVTKVFEKAGEKIGEKAVEAGGKLLSVLKRKDPATATVLERVAQQTDFAEQTPVNLGIAELVSKVKTLAQEDPEVQAAVEAVANETRSQPSTICNMTQLAEKIGILIQGGYNPIRIDKI